MPRTWIDAGAQSTVPGSINNSQTTIVLLSSANFGAPSAVQPLSVVILDSGNPAYSAANPLATPYEYQLITNNVIGTNTLTINGGVRTGYAGTTPKAFFAGATVAAVFLAEDITSTLVQKLDERVLGSAQALVRFPASGVLPTGYRFYVVEYNVRGDNAAANITWAVTLNDDTTNGNYAWQRYYATAATNNPGESTGDSKINAGFIPSAGANGGEVGRGTVKVVPSLISSRCAVRVEFDAFLTATFTTGQLASGFVAGVYFATGTPTSITLTPSGGNLIANSWLGLYGYP